MNSSLLWFTFEEVAMLLPSKFLAWYHSISPTKRKRSSISSTDQGFKALSYSFLTIMLMNGRYIVPAIFCTIPEYPLLCRVIILGRITSGGR